MHHACARLVAQHSRQVCPEQASQFQVDRWKRRRICWVCRRREYCIHHDCISNGITAYDMDMDCLHPNVAAMLSPMSMFVGCILPTPILVLFPHSKPHSRLPNAGRLSSMYQIVTIASEASEQLVSWISHRTSSLLLSRATHSSHCSSAPRMLCNTRLCNCWHYGEA